MAPMSLLEDDMAAPLTETDARVAVLRDQLQDVLAWLDVVVAGGDLSAGWHRQAVELRDDLRRTLDSGLGAGELASYQTLVRTATTTHELAEFALTLRYLGGRLAECKAALESDGYREWGLLEGLPDGG